MPYVTVDVDIDEVLGELSDRDLLKEVEERNLGTRLEGARKEDLCRALAGRDWDTVDYLLRTYFLRQEMQVIPTPRRVLYGDTVNGGLQ